MSVTNPRAIRIRTADGWQDLVSVWQLPVPPSGAILPLPVPDDGEMFDWAPTLTTASTNPGATFTRAAPVWRMVARGGYWRFIGGPVAGIYRSGTQTMTGAVGAWFAFDGTITVPMRGLYEIGGHVSVNCTPTVSLTAQVGPHDNPQVGISVNLFAPNAMEVPLATLPFSVNIDAGQRIGWHAVKRAFPAPGNTSNPIFDVLWVTLRPVTIW